MVIFKPFDRFETTLLGLGEAAFVDERRGHGTAEARRDGRDRAVQPGPGAVTRSSVRLGLGPNLAQFSLLVVVNAFVGAMVGLERTILPAIAEQEFHLAARAAVLSFIVVFGVTKALTNYFAGRLSDRGRPQARAGRRMARRAAGPVLAHVGAVVGLDLVRERASSASARA